MTRPRGPRLELVGERPLDAPLPDESECGTAADARHAHELVRAAFAPTPLDPIDHELLLALSLGEELANIPAGERRVADELASRLEPLLGSRAGASAAPLATTAGESSALRATIELALAVRNAAAPRALDEVSHERTLQAALRRPHLRRPGSKAWLFVSSAVAIAAGVALFVTSATWRGGEHVAERPGAPGAAPTSETPAAELIPARSTQSLFDPAAKFPVRGGESSRVDKIASARMADLRANRYAQWGVR